VSRILRSIESKYSAQSLTCFKILAIILYSLLPQAITLSIDECNSSSNSKNESER
jgi:hypothetical protein